MGMDAGIALGHDATLQALLAAERRLEQALAERHLIQAALEADLHDTQLLRDLGVRLVAESDMRVLYEEIVTAAMALAHADAGSVQLLDEDTRRRVLVAARGWVEEDQGHSTPLMNLRGECIGSICIAWREPRRPTERELRYLDLLARQAADLIGGKRSEAALRASEAALRQSQQQLALIADSAPISIVYMDRDERYRFANPVYLRRLGKSLEEIMGRSVRDVVGEAIYAEMAPRMATALAGMPQSYEMHARFENVGERDLHVRYSPVTDAKGETHGVVALIEDITERRHAEVALGRAARQKDEFLAMLSHELRNPLAPIMNAVRVLRRLQPLPEGVEAMRAIIEQQAQQLTALVDDLLDVSRITQGRITLRKTETDLMSVLSPAIDAARPLMDARDQRLTVSMPGERVRIEADVARLSQAIANLLNNAAKYTPERGRIELRAEVCGRELVIRVKDDGIGIAPEDLGRIFDLFQQAKRSLDRSQGGLGIGLTIVKSLAEMHGGSAEAESRGIGQGSEFVLRLPVVHNRPAPAPTAKASLQPAPAPDGLRILVVDDNDAVSGSMAVLLRMDGHDVRIAADGDTALATARAFRPQLVLLDIGLPKKDGYQIAGEFRADPSFANLLLVALTGYGQAEDRARSLEAGFDEHLTKPVADEAVQQVIDTARRRSQRARS